MKRRYRIVKRFGRWYVFDRARASQTLHSSMEECFRWVAVLELLTATPGATLDYSDTGDTTGWRLVMNRWYGKKLDIVSKYPDGVA